MDVPRGPSNLEELPERQHAWNSVLSTDDYGNTIVPRHHGLLFLNYNREGTPTDSDRQTMETALQGIEHAYERSGDGLLMTVGYSPTYFGRFEQSLPEMYRQRGYEDVETVSQESYDFEFLVMENAIR
ncbi:DUF7405 family protein [Natrialba taiwanensis]|uniref:DUF7405 family protein n=1 Tax=Natrialba taiwanensis TaxID=160846 RepID=UPI001269017E|nr:hypothetical protein [Natrialba taiwanensis]